MRRAEYRIDSRFIERHSWLAMADQPVTDVELFSLFEAARWAPSSYNNQPWRFIYTRKGSAAWQALFDCLVPYNQQWAINAPVLVLVVARTHFEHNDKPSRTHSFDAGAAWQSLCLQASGMGINVRGIGGFDYERSARVMQLPALFAPQAIAVIGKEGTIDDVPESLKDKEQETDRDPVSKFVFEGTFGAIT